MKEKKLVSKRINISVSPRELHDVWILFYEENLALFDSLSGMIKTAMRELMDRNGFNWKQALADRMKNERKVL